MKNDRGPSMRKNKLAADIGRRRWLQSAATLAAAPLLSRTSDAAGQASPAPKQPATRTVIAPNSGNVVEIASGKIRGFSRNGILTFKGIPYGNSTADAFRYMAPAKPSPWKGVRSCMALGPACPQPFHVPEGRRAGWSHDEDARFQMPPSSEQDSLGTR